MSLILICLSVIILLLFVVLLIYNFNNVSPQTLCGRHVFITGGTKGIGLELAKICVQNGAHVTIIARDIECLEKIKLDLIKMSDSSRQHILSYSVDLSETVVFNLEKAIMDSETHSGPISLLICCAGTAIAKTFEDSPLEDFRRMMDINYFGTVNTIKACLPSLKKNQDGARILMFSSLAGIFGLYGYSAYSASKFAIIGLAEVLDMELRCHNISITVSLPPDTDTPGFKNEQIGKPQITKIISEDGGLYSPEVVANKSLKDCLNKEFISTIGLNGLVLSTLCSGMMPTRRWPKRILQICFMGLLRLIGLHFLYSCQKIIEKNNRKEITLRSKSD